MAGYIGEFPCTIDAKGRFLLPVALKKQIPVKEQKQFVVHRGRPTRAECVRTLTLLRNAAVTMGGVVI